jgi:hypothetical protein
MYRKHTYLPILLVILIVLLLVALPLSVMAQAASAPALSNPCNVQPTNGYYVYRDYVAPIAPTCAAATPVQYSANSAGITSWRYCQQADQTWLPQWGALAASAATPSMLLDFLKAGPQPSAVDIARLSALYVTKPLADPSMTPVWCPAWPTIWAGRPQPPAAPAWKTASTLAFTVRAGALGGLAGTVRLGVACDCTAKTVIGSRTYCTFTGAATPQTMTVCTQ